MVIQQARFVGVKCDFLFEIEDLCSYEYVKFSEEEDMTGPRLIMSVLSSKPKEDALGFLRQFSKRRFSIILRDSSLSDKGIPFHLLHNLRLVVPRPTKNHVEVIFEYLSFGSRDYQTQQFLNNLLMTEWNTEEHRYIKSDLEKLCLQE